MKRCPKCKDNKVIMFDSDNDWCEKCKIWFPAVAEEEDACETGCKYFHGGEIKHHKDCFYYPESLTEMYDKLKTKDKKLITKLADDICAIAKKMEVSEESKELKTISSCLHDMRADRDTSWYK